MPASQAGRVGRAAIDVSLLQVCKTQEEKIIQLLKQQSEMEDRNAEREKHLTDMQWQLATASDGKALPPSDQVLRDRLAVLLQLLACVSDCILGACVIL